MSSVTLFQRLCQQPDSQEVWREFYGYYAPWVLGWATESTGRHDVGEDITQTIFLRICQRLDSLREQTPGSLRGWISTAVYHLIVDWKRDPHYRRFQRFLGDDPGAADDILARVAARVDDLDEYLDRAEMCERYVLAWEDMPAQSRIAESTVLSFLLRVRGELSSDKVKAMQRLESSQAVNTNVKRVRDYLAGEVNLPREHARWIDHLDKIALESAVCAHRLEKCAQRYGYPPDARPTSGLS